MLVQDFHPYLSIRKQFKLTGGVSTTWPSLESGVAGGCGVAGVVTSTLFLSEGLVAVLLFCSPVFLFVLCGFKLALPYFPRIFVARVGRRRFFNRESVNG